MSRNLKSSELLKILTEDIKDGQYIFKDEGQMVEDYIKSVQDFEDTYRYIHNQLSKLQESKFNKSLIISDELGNKTFNIALTKTSIPILIEYLQDSMKGN